MGELLLSLFPGADLFGRAFELAGCSVVRGPDLLWGHDVREWVRPRPGTFDGVIGGPPCSPFSRVRKIGGHAARHADGIPIFWDVVRELRPRFAVMENVVDVIGHKSIPGDAEPIVLRDWDCGGLTSRERVFFVWPRDLGDAFLLLPDRRDGKPAYTVLASSNKSRGFVHGHKALTPRDAGRLQGWPEIVRTIEREADRGRKGNRMIGARLIVHMLGNGVPRAMGELIASRVMAHVRREAPAPCSAFYALSSV